MTDILERLRAYNPPDRVLGNKQSQIATDIAEAAAEISFLRREVERLQLRVSTEAARIYLNASVECPHCHWGFHPSVIDQHIRERH